MGKGGWPLKILGLAALYAAGGWAGTLLAIPPGFSSGLWLPAGLALMALLMGGRRLWPGVLLGSFAVNLAIAAKATGAAATLGSLAPVALGIAAGSTLQALVGAHLVRRQVGYPTALDRPWAIVRFLGLGGPVACLISASLAVALLAGSGTIPLANVPFAWFNWFVGDTIGVLVVAPVTLVLFGQPASAWRPRRLQVALPVGVSLAVVLGAFFLVGHQEDQRVRAVFDRKAEEVTHRIQTALDGHLTILSLTRDHFLASGPVDRAGFHRFTRDILGQNATLQALEWVPRVPAANRAAFEAAARQGDPGRPGPFRILEGHDQGGLRPAGDRDAYFPVLFLEPYPGNEKAEGFDLGSEPRRREAMDKALRTGQAAATVGVPLLQERAGQAGVLVFLPVFQGGSPATGPLTGYVLGVFRVGDLVDKSLAGLDLAGVRYRVAEADGPSLLLHSPDGAPAALLAPFQNRQFLTLAGRRWVVQFEPTLGFLDAHRSPLPWMMQLAGLIITGLLGLFVLELCIHQETLAAREVQQAKAEAQARLEGIFQSATEFAIITTDLAGVIQVFSPGAERMLGYSAAEVVGRATPKLLHLDREVRERGHLLSGERGLAALTQEEVARHYPPGGSEWTYVRKDGSTLPVLLVVTPILEGQRVTGLLGIAKDFSAIRKAERDLRQSEEEYQILFENLPVSLFVKEAAELRYVRVNRAWEELQGCARESILGKTDVQFFPERQAADFISQDRAAIAGLHPLDIPAGRMQTLHRGERILHTIKVPVLDPDGAPRYLLGISEDITDRNKAMEDRALLEDRLRQAQKMESLGVLAGGVAHDMNNVLGAILGLASVHLHVQPVGSDAHSAFATIAQAATRGGKMVKSLLGFARQHPAEVKELDLNAIIREEVQLLAQTTLATVGLEVDLDPALPPIKGDAGTLTHAVMNLCVNAVDAMAGAGTLTIRTRDGGDGWVELRVQDTGCGMDEAVLQKALDPFFTTKAVGKGTGLGLSMVYSTVMAHHGHMDLESAVGQGTLVTLRFPASEARAPGVPATPATPAQAPRQALSVLLVDDDDLVQASTRVVLEALGHRVTIVPSGEACLALLRDGQQVDRVILDLNMPGLGGAATLPLLRTLRPALPVLLATGRADQVALDLVAAHPGVSLMAKPFGLEELRKQLG